MNNRVRLCSLMIGALMAARLLPGCSNNNSEGENPRVASRPPRPKTRGRIGLSVLTLTNPFFKVIADTMAAEAKQHGYEVVAVSGEFDVARQESQVKDFIVQKVAAIVLTPCDSRAIGPAVQEANRAGIPVFTADIKCLAPRAEVVSHIATDNYSGGKQAGEEMVKVLGGKGKVAILDFAEVESVMLRTKGFEEVIARANKSGGARIDIVARLPGGGVKDKSFKAAEDLLQTHPDLKGIFAINDPSALGARAALEKMGKAKNVVIIGFDGQPEGKQAIKEGKIHADPVQFPDRIGRETVTAIRQHFEGERPPKELLIPTSLYRREDALRDPTLTRGE